jgi:hypothetical protein
MCYSSELIILLCSYPGKNQVRPFAFALLAQDSVSVAVDIRPLTPALSPFGGERGKGSASLTSDVGAGIEHRTSNEGRRQKTTPHPGPPHELGKRGRPPHPGPLPQGGEGEDEPEPPSGSGVQCAIISGNSLPVWRGEGEAAAGRAAGRPSSLRFRRRSTLARHVGATRARSPFQLRFSGLLAAVKGRRARDRSVACWWPGCPE